MLLLGAPRRCNLLLLVQVRKVVRRTGGKQRILRRRIYHCGRSCCGGSLRRRLRRLCGVGLDPSYCHRRRPRALTSPGHGTHWTHLAAHGSSASTAPRPGVHRQTPQTHMRPPLCPGTTCKQHTRDPTRALAQKEASEPLGCQDRRTVVRCRRPRRRSCTRRCHCHARACHPRHQYTATPAPATPVAASTTAASASSSSAVDPPSIHHAHIVALAASHAVLVPIIIAWAQEVCAWRLMCSRPSPPQPSPAAATRLRPSAPPLAPPYPTAAARPRAALALAAAPAAGPSPCRRLRSLRRTSKRWQLHTRNLSRRSPLWSWQQDSSTTACKH